MNLYLYRQYLHVLGSTPHIKKEHGIHKTIVVILIFFQNFILRQGLNVAQAGLEQHTAKDRQLTSRPYLPECYITGVHPNPLSQHSEGLVNLEFKASPGFILRSCLKKELKTNSMIL